MLKQGQRAPQFGRQSMLSATEILSRLNHAPFERMLLELGLEDTNAGEGNGLAQRSISLAKFALKNPLLATDEGSNLWDALVFRAFELVKPNSWGTRDEKSDALKFERSLERDGFTYDQNGLHRTLPEIVDFPVAEDEVSQLLEALQLDIARNHLRQAIANHSAGNWEAANSQSRTFMEALFESVAMMIDPVNAANQRTAYQRRILLANVSPPFLYRDTNEWDDDGKGYINGLFNRLNPKGSHPGISDEEDCTFRLQIVLVTARQILRRLYARIN